MADEKKYWFPAKRYGWGWGCPSSWHGWVVLVAFFSLMGFGALLFSPKSEAGSYAIYVVFLSIILIAICWWKGEPPR